MYLSMVNLHIESPFRYGKSKWPSISSSHFGLVGRLGLGVGVKTSIVILCGGGLGVQWVVSGQGWSQNQSSYR